MSLDDSLSKVLMHFDGTNGGTSFIDESGKSWTATNATTSTTQSKFGGASGYFNGGTNNNITSPHTTDMVFSGDFTFDWWSYLSSKTGGRWVYFGGSAGDIMVGFDGGNLAIGRSSVVVDKGYAHGINVNTWAHFAISRSGSTIYFFANGSLLGSAGNTTAYVSTGTQAIGGRPSTDSYYGYLDELRISVGIARWTSNFLVPTSAYGSGGILTPIWFM